MFGNHGPDLVPEDGPKVDRKGSIGDLLSKNLRAYRSGDSLGHDYRADRANIEIDPNTLRIVDVWFG